MPPLTTSRRLGRGAVLRRGTDAAYHAVTITAGEPHLLRSGLGRGGARPAARGPGGGTPARPLLCLAHVTDLQLADVQSPARFEFLNRYFADPRYAALVPVQRPQEALAAHAADATVRTLNALRGPATGLAPQLVVTTGDAIDNAQWNETQLLLALLDGGEARPGSGGRGYFGVQSAAWPDDIFWRPDGPAGDGPGGPGGPGAGGPDWFRRALGFPHYPGLLDRAMRSFGAPGLAMPWLACFGNHELLAQGVGRMTPELAAALTGDRKPAGLPASFDHDQALALFTAQPAAFMAGPAVALTPDPGRRPVSRAEFVAAHRRPGARPAGHGFTAANERGGTAYYAYDTPAVRLIALDTSCPAGGAAGCLGAEQARWLEAELAQAHAAPAGRPRTAGGHPGTATGTEDRLVVLFSHHGLDTLHAAGHPGPDGEPRLGRAQAAALVHRFPNVVLWLNGHTHVNAVRPRPAPGGRHGFWEVTTCAVADWPGQTRIVELSGLGAELSVVCTMADHAAPLTPGAAVSVDELAALHRELSLNVPPLGAHADPGEGRPQDRNVDLRLPAPLPLSRLPRTP